MTRASGKHRSGMPLRLGVIGCGLVAQSVHFHHLSELTDRFQVRALCDISPGALAFSGERFFPKAVRFADWQELLEEPLDAVMILTPGSHAPIAIAAAERGLHLFVEKPLAFSVQEGATVLAAADRAGVSLTVGYMKRYDLAYERLLALMPAITDLRLVRVTTLESAIDPYVGHYSLHRPCDIGSERLELLEADDRERIFRAIGDTARDPGWYWAYRVVLLDCMVHEFNALRGLLGEPSELRFASASAASGSLAAILTFGQTECVLAWVDLPGMAHYEQEISLFAPNQRLGLRFPSPFLRNVPTILTSEGGTPGAPDAWQTTEHVGYESAFKRELIEFHESAVGGREPRTGGNDAIRDLSLCEAFIRAATEGTPQSKPTDQRVSVSR
jgi:predicted dehydrogenase